jgi:hypothetical protein
MTLGREVNEQLIRANLCVTVVMQKHYHRQVQTEQMGERLSSIMLRIKEISENKVASAWKR